MLAAHEEKAREDLRAGPRGALEFSCAAARAACFFAALAGPKLLFFLRFGGIEYLQKKIRPRREYRPSVEMRRRRCNGRPVNSNFHEVVLLKRVSSGHT